MKINTDNALAIINQMHTAKTLEDGFKDVAEDVVCYDWTKAGVVNGKEAVLEQIIRPSDRAFRNENFDINYIVVGEETGMVTVDAVYSADFLEEYKGIPAHGKRVSWRIRDMFLIENNMITCMWYASDTLEMLQSLEAVDFTLP
ncbi:MAG: ester cyclase [Gammaproteobacteria bacterium]|nr:ester cyclase [Gammaproteobacteria bacterium]